jgi:hypothetical protein
MPILKLGFAKGGTRAGVAQSVHRLGYGLDDWVSIPGRGKEGNFSLRHSVHTGSGAHTASYPMGIRGSFPRGKRPLREADHSPPSSAEVKNARSYTPLAHTSSWRSALLRIYNVFMVW